MNPNVHYNVKITRKHIQLYNASKLSHSQPNEKDVTLLNSCDTVLNENIKMWFQENYFSDSVVNTCSYSFDTNSCPQNLNQNVIISCIL